MEALQVVKKLIRPSCAAGLFAVLVAMSTASFARGSGKRHNAALDAQLIAAIKANKGSEVQTLLEKGADPNAIDSTMPEHPSALLVATDWRSRVTSGHIRLHRYNPGNPPPENNALVTALLKKGANIHVRNTVNCTPLMIAAWEGRSETVQILLRSDHDINAQGKDGWTALMFAIVSGSEPTVRALLRAHPDINTIHSTQGYTALLLAQVRKDSGMIRLLQSASKH